MAISNMSMLRKKIKVRRKKGYVGVAVDGVAGFWREWIWQIFKWLFLSVLIGAALSIVLVVMLRFVNPYMTYYFVSERMRLGTIERDWTPLKEFSPVVARSVVAAEDANFCLHIGFDIEGIK